MTYGMTIGDTAYSTRADALAGEVGKWATAGGEVEILDHESAAAEIRASQWLDESFGDVKDGELRDAIEAHNEWVRDRLQMRSDD